MNQQSSQQLKIGNNSSFGNNKRHRQLNIQYNDQFTGELINLQRKWKEQPQQKFIKQQDEKQYKGIGQTEKEIIQQQQQNDDVNTRYQGKKEQADNFQIQISDDHLRGQISQVNNIQNKKFQQQQIEQNNQEQVTVLTRRKHTAIKVIICLSLFCALLLFIGSFIYLIVHFLTNSESNQRDPIAQVLLFQRSFKQYEVNKLQYEINTNMSSVNQQSDRKVKIKYEVLMVVMETLPDPNGIGNITSFTASLAKKSEERLFINGSVEQTQQFDNSTMMYDILKGKIDDYEGQSENDTNLQQDFEASCQEIKSQTNQTINCQSPIMSVFDFSLYANGTIRNIQFPLEMKKQEVALLQTFIKLFSPLLDKKLYQQGKQIKTARRLFSNPSFANNDSTESQNLQYTQEDYNFAQEGDQITLQKQANISSNSDAYNSQETTKSKSQFTNGKLTSSEISSVSQFSPEQSQNQSDPDNLYATEPINLNISIASNQQCHLKVLQQFSTDNEKATQFRGFLITYRQQNKTKLTSLEGLMNYILEQNNISKPGESRLLQQQNGYELIIFSKKTNILKTSLLGFKIAAFGYFRMGLDIISNPKNRFERSTRFIVDMGLILNIGIIQLQINIAFFQHRFPPLSLLYTLDQIQSVINDNKENFVAKSLQLSNKIPYDAFKFQIADNLQDLIRIINGILTAINRESGGNSPQQIMDNIYEIIRALEQTYEKEGLQLLSNDNKIIPNLTNNIYSYVNQTYENALQIFELSKDSLQQIQLNATSFFMQAKDAFLEQNITEIKQQIDNLISPYVYEQYKAQIQKAQAILDTIQYIQINGKQYFEEINQILNEHQNNLLQMFQNVINMYFQDQANVTNSSDQEIISIQRQLISQINALQTQHYNIRDQANKTMVKFFSPLFVQKNSNSSYFRMQFNLFIQKITSYATSAKNEAHNGCCSYDRTWYGRLYCQYYNYGYGYQASQPIYWNETRKKIQQSIKNYILAMEQFTNSTRIILQNLSMPISEKFNSIQTAYSKHVPAFSFNIEMIQQAIDLNINKTRNFGVNCGSTSYLLKLRNELYQLKYFCGNYSLILDKFTQEYQLIIEKFDSTGYQTIMENSRFTESTQQFFNNYNNDLENIVSAFQRLDNISQSFSPKQFVQNDALITEISHIYKLLKANLSQLCQSKEDNQQKIEQIRQQYNSSYQNVYNLTDKIWSKEMQMMKLILSQASNAIFKNLLQAQFCNISQQLDDAIQFLQPNFDNFTELFEIWNSFVNVKQFTQNQTENLTQQFQKLSGKFFQLFTPQDYNNFINKSQNIANQIVNATQNTSFQLSYVKQSANEITIFEFSTSSSDEINDAIQIFADTNFTLSSTDLFPNLTQLIPESYSVIQTLSFDIITVYVAANNIRQYFQTTKETFSSGIDIIRLDFSQVCENFIRLNKNVTQDYLIQIDNKMRNIIKTINSTIGPNITDGFNKITQKFKVTHFQNEQMKNVLINMTNVLEDFVQLLRQIQINIYEQSQQMVSNAIQLIDKLQIGSLNSLFQLATNIQQKYQKIFPTYTQIIQKILDFSKFVDEDFSNIFKFDQFLGVIENQAEESLNKISITIKEEISQKKHAFQNNTNFYEKFKQENISSQLEEVEDNGIKIGIESIWNSDQSKQKFQQINNLTQSISGKLYQYLYKINKIKNKTKDIENNIGIKVASINAQFSLLKKKFKNMMQMAFINLQNDINEVMIGSAGKIIATINELVVDNLSVIEEIDSYDILMNDNQSKSEQEEFNKTNALAIKNFISAAVFRYKNIKLQQNVFVAKMQRARFQIDKFAKTNLTRKIHHLQSGKIFIKSKSFLKPLVKQQQLFQLESSQFTDWYGTKQKYKNPSSNSDQKGQFMQYYFYKQAVPTKVGVFYIGFSLKLDVGFQLFGSLTNYRDIDIGCKLSTALVVQATFSYGIAFVFEIGIYARGKFLQAQIIPKFTFESIIPIQLVQEIEQITQITNQNNLVVYFIVDFALNSVQVSVGFFINFVWFQIYWIRVRVCIRLWRRYCFSFRIPIFIPRFRRQDFGFKIAGPPLLETRIVELKLLSKKY